MRKLSIIKFNQFGFSAARAFFPFLWTKVQLPWLCLMQPPSAHRLTGTCRQAAQTKISYQFDNPAPALHRLRLEGNYGTSYDLKLVSEEGPTDARFLVSHAYFQHWPSQLILQWPSAAFFFQTGTPYNRWCFCSYFSFTFSSHKCYRQSTTPSAKYQSTYWSGAGSVCLLSFSARLASWFTSQYELALVHKWVFQCICW